MGTIDHNGDQEPIRIKRTSSAPSLKIKILRFLFIALVIFGLMVYIPLDFVIFQPGTAEDVHPMVHVEQSDPDETGEFMLTTVRLSYSNTLTYVMALFNPNKEIFRKKDVFRNGESQAEYTNRQKYVMLTSQSNALQASYKQAEIPYHIRNEGVVILQTLEDKPAAEILKAGDRILQIDHKKIDEAADVLAEMKTKKIGDLVTVTYRRDKVTKTEKIEVANIAAKQDSEGKPLKPQPGLGIVPADLQSVAPDDPKHKVEIKAGDIGGPSAGLMFALEIYNQLKQGDLTKGYRIAGTGEIDPDGNVGVIGGIHHKIVAADRVGADIFFAPADYYPEEGKLPPVRNYSDAVKKAKQIGTKMKVVRVETIQDALDYLEKLPLKK